MSNANATCMICTYNDKYIRMYEMGMRWEYEQFRPKISKIFQVLRMKITYFRLHANASFTFFMNILDCMEN